MAVSGKDYVWLAILTNEAGDTLSNDLKEGPVFGGGGIADGDQEY
jgi:hypothetical protein